MKEAQVILNRLLDKFENSKHLSEPNTSRRRVMLRIDKGSCRSINTKMRWFGMLIILQRGSWSSRLWCVWNGRESRAFSPALCWIWNGSHSAMNAPTECIREKGRRGCKHHHAEAGRQSRSMDRGMEGCCMCSGAEQHESADVLQRKRRSAAGAFAHVSTVCGVVRQCDDACIQQPVFSRYQVF